MVSLLRVVLAVSLHDPYWRYIQDLCVRLSRHAHFNVRGNAILGFGDIARRFRCLDRQIVQPIIQAGLDDDEESAAAMDDTIHFLKWDGYKPSRDA